MPWILIASTAWALDWVELPAARIVPAPAGVVVDGVLDDWVGVPRQTHDGGPDLRLEWIVAQDEHGLLLLVHLVDDVVLAGPPLTSDHLELWLYDPSVRRSARCVDEWKGLCEGEEIPARGAAPEATRHVLVAPSGAVHVADGQGAPTDGREVTSAWRAGAGAATVELRIPLQDLPFTDEVDVASLGVVLDVFDNDLGTATQEQVWSTSPRHGWWTLAGEPAPLPRPWPRDPRVATVLRRSADVVGPPTLRPAVLCTPGLQGRPFLCIDQPPGAAAPLAEVAVVELPSETGGELRTVWIAAGESLVDLQGHVSWTGRVDGADCLATKANLPSGCYGAGCGATTLQVEVLCAREGSIRRQLLPDEAATECGPASRRYDEARAGERGPAAFWDDEYGYLFVVDASAGTLTVEQPCPEGGFEARVWRIRPGGDPLLGPP